MKRPFLSVTTTLRLTASTVDRNWMRPSCESREGSSWGKQNDGKEMVLARNTKTVRTPYGLAKRLRPAGWLMDVPLVSARLGGSKRRRCGAGGGPFNPRPPL